MEKRIELELRGREPSEVHELNLDNSRTATGQMTGLTSAFTGLERLSLIGTGLNTLKDFPKLPALKRLEMSDNRLVGGLEHLTGCPNITHLNISGNLFKDVDSLAPLKNLPQLKSVDLFNRPVTANENFRTEIFNTLPQVKYVDGFDKDDKEAEDSEDDGIDENELDEDVDDDDDDEDDGDANEDEDETEDFEPGADDDEDDDDLDETGEGDDDGHDESNDAGENNTSGRKRKHAEDEDDDEDSQD